MHESIGSTRTARAASLLACGLIAVLMAGSAKAQSNLRERWAKPVRDTLRIDTVSLVPGSLTLVADSLPVPPDRYIVLPYQGLVVWKNAPDSVLARYRAMPLMLGGRFQHKDPARISSDPARPDPFRYEPPKQEADLMGLRGLQRSGSISRGVLFGNNQDLSVNSTLNLQLGGRLTDRIGVAASITDNNIPIQSGGNTAELQDFDQVFIKLFEESDRGPGNRWELIAGDFVLQKPKSHFLTYLKKAKGLSYDLNGRIGDARTSTGVSAAISKGKFARNVIQGIEGVQGPYRLRGNEIGSVIIVLSGSERVFIDGQLMNRGQENDYVIDYNTAELSFTARQLITKDRRITVEFQYSDKNYARSLLRFDQSIQKGRTTMRFNGYSEQDHRNQPLQQGLAEAERRVLADAGDDPLAAATIGVDSTGYLTDQVLYRRTDSLGYDPVFVYSTDPTVALYRVVFSQVGTGSGDYVLQEFTPNGRVFRWVPPDTVDGAVVRRGDHAPVRLLVAPRAQQLLTLGVEHRFNSRSSVAAEGAFSHLDANTFSALDRADDDGFGLLLKGTHAIPISGNDSSLHLVLGAEAEGVSRHFRFVERYRAVEFDRNWNVLGLDLASDQLLAGATLGVRGNKLGRASYGFGTFQADGLYSGWKHDLQSDLHVQRFDLTGTASWLRADASRSSDFVRNKGQARYRLKPLSFGLKSENERNRFTTEQTTGLQPGSYAFEDLEAFVQSPDSARNKWRASAGRRTDHALRDGALRTSTIADAYSATVDLARNPRNRFAATGTYRALRIVDSTLTAQKPQDTYLARVDYDLTLWKGVAVLDLFNEFSSGLEQRREYLYVQVPAGQGLYIWNDYNGNGVKELNEFELANFAYEADYLRVFVPSNDYVRSFGNQSSASLDLRPGVKWADAKGPMGLIGKFSDLFSMRVDRRSANPDPLKVLDPFAPERTDTLLTSFASNVRNTVYYDRASRIWSVDHTWQSDRSRNLLLNGYESRSREANTVRARINITRQWTLDVEGERGRSGNSSDLLEGRSWAIEQDALRPRLTWQPNTSVRALASYKATSKRNRAEFGGEKAESHDLGLEFRYNTAGKGSLQITVNWVEIRFEGSVNSALGNELLGGLRPGTNGTWSVSLQRNLSGNLQVDLTYNGRRSEGAPVIHVGGAQVRAFF
jgi:hypothetical protein